MFTVFKPLTIIPKSYEISCVIQSTIKYENLLINLDVNLPINDFDNLTTNQTPGISSTDNVYHELLLKRGMRIEQYEVINLIGAGSFGQVVSARDENGVLWALKIVRSDPAYFRAGCFETAILREISLWNCPHAITAHKQFVFSNHIVIVFDLLKTTLHSILDIRGKGLSVRESRLILTQILSALTTLGHAGIIHADVKPENIMMRNGSFDDIVLIDFGSSCFMGEIMQQCVQSRYYRAPEVILGLPYDSAIDMWSVGCIAVELLFGLPLFPGSSDYNQLEKIIDIIGLPPTSLLEKAPLAKQFFIRREKCISGKKAAIYLFKSRTQYEADTNEVVEQNIRYNDFKSLNDITSRVPFRLQKEDIHLKPEFRSTFLLFLKNTLTWKPEDRMKPDQAKLHPFLTKKRCHLYHSNLPPSKITSTKVTRISGVDATNIILGENKDINLEQLSNHTYFQIFEKALNCDIILDIRNKSPFNLPPFVPCRPPNEVWAALIESGKTREVEEKIQKQCLNSGKKNEIIESESSDDDIEAIHRSSISKCVEKRVPPKHTFQQPTSTIQKVKTISDVRRVSIKNPTQKKVIPKLPQQEQKQQKTYIHVAKLPSYLQHSRSIQTQKQLSAPIKKSQPPTSKQKTSKSNCSTPTHPTRPNFLTPRCEKKGDSKL